MANPPQPWKAEYAKSSRSSCKTCKTPIEKETLRLGKIVHSTQFDGFMPMWNHAACILNIPNQIKSADDVEGLQVLRSEDQHKISKYVDSADSAVVSNPYAFASVECAVEVSKTSRANCHICHDKIIKDEIRISTKPDGQGARSLTWNHAKCYLETTSSSSQLEKIPGWDTLSNSHHATLLSLAKKNTSTSKGTKAEHEEQSSSKGKAKRKKALESDQKSKIAKLGGDASSSD